MSEEQKQRMTHELGQWNAAMKSSCSVSDLLAISTRMAALLQELVDAPEPKPVAWIMQNRLTQACYVYATEQPADPNHIQVPVYTAPPAPEPEPSVPDGRKMVPDEPTAEMREAGHRAAWQSVPSLFDRDDVANVYRAMLAAAPAARLEDQPPPADVAMLASANRELSTRMAKVIAALHKAPVPFAEAIDNDKYLVSNVETIVAELIGEQVRASELQELVIGLRTLLDQVRHTLDLSPAASSMDILAEIENLSRLADRAIQPGASDATQSLYTIISDPRGAAGIYETIEDARQHAEITARRSTFGRAAIVTIVAEVAMVPQWEGEA